MALRWADVVIVATGADHPVICRADVSSRHQRTVHCSSWTWPFHLTSISSGGTGRCPGLGIDELDSSALENLDKRRAAVPEVEKLIDTELSSSWAGGPPAA